MSPIATSNRRIGGRRAAFGNDHAAVGTPEHPLITVITVVRNGSKTLEACLRSVMAQTWPNVQHVIVDGGSSDGTLDILERFDQDIDCWISEPDDGIYDALNKGLRLASGDAYIVLGCDDLLLPTGIESLVRNAGGAEIVFGRVSFETPGKGIAYIRNHSAGTLISLAAHEKLGPYDTSYRIAADTKFLKTAQRAGMTREIDDVVGVFTAGGASANYRSNVLEHARAMRESGAWNAWQALLWRSPRLVFAALRK